MRMSAFCVIAACVAFPSASAAAADVVATYRTASGGRLTIEASAQGWGRLETRSRDGSASESYTLIAPDARNLRVFRHEGSWRVADAADYQAWLDRDAEPAAALPAPKQPFVEIGEEKVGAWTGTAYRAAEPCWDWHHFVVMKKPGLEVFGRVLRANLLAGAKTKANAPACEYQAIDLIGSGLLLRMNDSATLESYTVGAIDSARFHLPSAVLSRAELFRLLGTELPKLLPPVAADRD